MTRFLQRFLLLSAVLCGLLTGGLKAATLQLNPAGGAIAGLPGATVGWGFTLTNDTDFLLVTSADFVTVTSLGTFTDYIAAFNFVLVGPPPETSPVSQAFNAGLLTGIGSFQISPLASAGDRALGEIVLTYDLFSVSPNDLNFDPVTDTVSVGNSLRANASVAAVPEPSTALLLGSALAGLWWRFRRRVGQQSG